MQQDVEITIPGGLTVRKLSKEFLDTFNIGRVKDGGWGPYVEEWRNGGDKRLF